MLLLRFADSEESGGEAVELSPKVSIDQTGHDIVQKAKNIAESSGIPVLYTSNQGGC